MVPAFAALKPDRAPGRWFREPRSAFPTGAPIPGIGWHPVVLDAALQSDKVPRCHDGEIAGSANAICRVSFGNHRVPRSISVGPMNVVP